MVSNWIVIERDLETVWAIIEGEFRRTLECPRGDLLGHAQTVKTRGYSGSPLKVAQKVVQCTPGQSIEIESHNQNDIINTRYRIEAVGPQATKVVLTVEGRNEGSKLRTWNYTLMSWPLFRSGAKKRLALQLQGLKQLVEGGRSK